jgi:hypothetical protein
VSWPFFFHVDGLWSLPLREVSPAFLKIAFAGQQPVRPADVRSHKANSAQKATAALAGHRSVADSVRESRKRTSLTRSKRLHGAFMRARHRCAAIWARLHSWDKP